MRPVKSLRGPGARLQQVDIMGSRTVTQPVTPGPSINFAAPLNLLHPCRIQDSRDLRFHKRPECSGLRPAPAVRRVFPAFACGTVEIGTEQLQCPPRRLPITRSCMLGRAECTG